MIKLEDTVDAYLEQQRAMAIGLAAMANAAQVYPVEIGLGLFGQFRSYLEGLRFAGVAVTWHEGRGWIAREFLLKCTPDVYQRIRRDWPSQDTGILARP